MGIWIAPSRSFLSAEERLAEAEPAIEDSLSADEVFSPEASPAVTDVGFPSDTIIYYNSVELDAAYFDGKRAQRAHRYANDPAYWLPKEPKPSRAPFNLEAFRFIGIFIKYLGYLLIAMVSLGAIYFLIKSFRQIYGVARTYEKAEATPAEENKSLPWLQMARDAAEKQLYEPAIKYYYRATLQALQQKGLLPLSDSLTSSEILARLATAGELKSEVGVLTRAHDIVIYGTHPLQTGEFNGLISLFEGLMSRVLRLPDKNPPQ